MWHARKMKVWILTMAFAVVVPSLALAVASKQAKPTSPTRNESSRLPNEQAAGSYVLVPVDDLALVRKATPNVVAPNSSDWGASIAAVAGAIMWPIVTLFLVLAMLRAPQIQVLLNFLNRRTSQIAILGVEIKLNDAAEATIDDLKTLVEKVPKSHQAWVHNTHLLEQFRCVTGELKTYLETKHPGYLRALCNEDELKKLRFTLHVPDIVFSHSVRQLVDYIGCGRGGAGRLFSVRRGIIGLAWRLQASKYQNQNFNEDELVEMWGMTRLEANDTSSGKTLLMAFVLKDHRKLPVGLLYVDGDIPSFFDSTRIGKLNANQVFSRIDQRVADSASNSGLISSLGELEKARVGVKQLDIYEIT